VPIDEHGAGHGPHTERKQRDFAGGVRTHLAISQAIIGKGWANPRYAYVDLTAGPGVVDGITGSPILFLEEARRQEVRVRAFLMDQHAASLEALRGRLDALGLLDGVHLVAGDNGEQVDTVIAALGQRPDTVFGLAYADPNGTEAPWDALRHLGWRFRHLDLLLYTSATNKKRVRAAPATTDKTFLVDRLRSLHKQHVLLRSPAGQHQWTFALLTNWRGLLGKFRREQFHDIDSPTGRAIAEHLNFSDNERRARQQPPLLIESPEDDA